MDMLRPMEKVLAATTSRPFAIAGYVTMYGTQEILTIQLTNKMQKIMYNERYGLEQAVIDGIKEMTRRTAYNGEISKPNWGICLEGKDKGKAYLCDGERVMAKSKYAIGEVVAIAQSYKSLGYDIAALGNHAGWNNKLYVCADFMTRQIRITDIRVERLQDISDEDCLKEGVMYYHDVFGMGYMIADPYNNSYRRRSYTTPRKAFSALINKVSGKGTWERNPWVFAYTFELVK